MGHCSGCMRFFAVHLDWTPPQKKGVQEVYPLSINKSMTWKSNLCKWGGEVGRRKGGGSITIGSVQKFCASWARLALAKNPSLPPTSLLANCSSSKSALHNTRMKENLREGQRRERKKELLTNQEHHPVCEEIRLDSFASFHVVEKKNKKDPK